MRFRRLAGGVRIAYIGGMSNLAFDTHEFVKELTGTGMKAEQAEVLARTYANLLTDRLATKDDLKALEQRVNGRIDLLHKDIEGLHKDMQAQEERLTAKMEAQEERLNGRIDGLHKDMQAQIEKAQTRTVIMVTGILGFLIVILQFYG